MMAMVRLREWQGLIVGHLHALGPVKDAWRGLVCGGAGSPRARVPCRTRRVRTTTVLVLSSRARRCLVVVDRGGRCVDIRVQVARVLIDLSQVLTDELV